ncbi:hypothetical protein CVT24_004361 [Panaeolus cyanescens]|uniref:RING-type domain-containing protein n=1 Tax=Panaeolus cyanescens TaxID=181874 RepID=A0A409YBG9_9AGAR|nr:hypothetical protein CVT24_004361 [Panaeolus cyanescens]
MTYPCPLYPFVLTHTRICGYCGVYGNDNVSICVCIYLRICAHVNYPASVISILALHPPVLYSPMQSLFHIDDEDDDAVAGGVGGNVMDYASGKAIDFGSRRGIDYARGKIVDYEAVRANDFGSGKEMGLEIELSLQLGRERGRSRRGKAYVEQWAKERIIEDQEREKRKREENIGKEMEEDMDCGICFEYSVVPCRTLCCGKVFCEEHLADWLHGPLGQGICPNCENPCSLNGGTVSLATGIAPTQLPRARLAKNSSKTIPSVTFPSPTFPSPTFPSSNFPSPTIRSPTMTSPIISVHGSAMGSPIIASESDAAFMSRARSGSSASASSHSSVGTLLSSGGMSGSDDSTTTTTATSVSTCLGGVKDKEGEANEPKESLEQILRRTVKSSRVHSRVEEVQRLHAQLMQQRERQAKAEGVVETAMAAAAVSGARAGAYAYAYAYNKGGELDGDDDDAAFEQMTKGESRDESIVSMRRMLSRVL